MFCTHIHYLPPHIVLVCKVKYHSPPFYLWLQSLSTLDELCSPISCLSQSIHQICGHSRTNTKCETSVRREYIFSLVTNLLQKLIVENVYGSVGTKIYGVPCTLHISLHLLDAGLCVAYRTISQDKHLARKTFKKMLSKDEPQRWKELCPS